MLYLKRQDLLDKAIELELNPKKHTKNLPEMYTRLANACNDSMELQCNIRYNIGELVDSFINTVRSGENSRYAKAWQDDFRDGKGAWEIKVSLNCYSLCTPLEKPMRTLLVTSSGAYLISKKALIDIFDNPYDYQDYIKMEVDGLRLKPAITELGKPCKWLNELLGF